MSVIDLHPEELIERAQRGTLTADERARLDEHLGRCVACRFELAVSRDFDDESARIDGLSARVADALREAASNDASEAPAPARKRMPHWAWAAAALLLFVSSGIATAQTGLLETVASYVIPRVERVFGKRETTREVARPKRASSAPRAATPVAPPPAPAPEAAPEAAPSEPVAAPEARPAPVHTASRHAARRRAPVHAPRAHPAVPAATRSASLAVPGGIAAPYLPPAAQAVPAIDAGAVITAASPAVAPAPVPAPASAPDPRVQAAAMFADANELRHAGRDREAVARYRELQSRHAGSPEARLSLVLLGRLALDRDESKTALASFDAYVATGERALREQALAGRALALAKLGRHAAACAAFDELLRSYPRSAYASVAQARCETD